MTVPCRALSTNLKKFKETPNLVEALVDKLLDKKVKRKNFFLVRMKKIVGTIFVSILIVAVCSGAPVPGPNPDPAPDAKAGNTFDLPFSECFRDIRMPDVT